MWIQMSKIYKTKQELKKILKRIRLLDLVATPFCIKWVFRHWYCKAMTRKRISGYKDERFSEVRNYANLYEGERCFIICTGPSLTVNDVDKLKGEFSFSMNSITRIFSKTDWRPSFYVIDDDEVYLKLEKDIASCDVKKFFTSDILLKNVGFCREVIPFPLDMLNHAKSGYHLAPKYDFSDNAYAIVYHGFTVTFSIMQLAVFMGFKEIYLLGCDCNYGGSKTHFGDYDVSLQCKPDTSEKRMIQAYRVAKKYADKHGIKICNATRGGNLEVFERVNFDALF